MSSTIETQAAQEVAVALPAATEEKFRDIDHKIAEVADEETDRQAHLGVDQVLTPEEIDKERKFLRKIDWHIVPLLMITYGVQVKLLTQSTRTRSPCHPALRLTSRLTPDSSETTLHGSPLVSTWPT
jgi:hypothetical protein